MSLKNLIRSPWMFAAVMLFGTNGGRKLIKSASKEVLKVGLVISERVKAIAAEVKEEASELVAEVQSERKAAEKQIQSD